ncbi:MAG: RecX family transcriptional regulator, partial [Sphingorhabdus sp.]
GYGGRRISEDLRAKGIAEDDAGDAKAESEAQKWQSADRFAQRKRIGPYATEVASDDLKRKQLAAFLRAGHEFEIARMFINCASDNDIDTV